MSDCSTRAYGVPSCERGVLYEIKRPSLKKLGEVHGEPPWTLEMPWPDALPAEAADYVGTVIVGGKKFEEVK